MTNQQTEKRAPARRFRFGQVQASVWYDKRQDSQGAIQDYWTVILDRSYRDESGNRKYGKTLGVRDLTDAIFVLQKASGFIMEQQEQRQATRMGQSMPEIEVEAVVG